MSYSPEVEVGTERSLRSTTRNPRRRQRQNDTESLKVAPRRKRSKISEDTFIPPRHEEEEGENGHVNGDVESPATNGDVQPASTGRARGRPRKEIIPAIDMDIPLRSKRNSVKRPTRGDGATVLAQNTRYSIKLLPSTPKDLRKEGLEWRGSIGAGHLALAVTRARAYIWDYTAHSPVTNPRVFDVPLQTKPTDALPYGALVSSGANTEIGLALVSATSGKVVFYESIERAASLGPFQERNIGVEGSLGSLFSGEVVIDVVSAQHAGFIVTLSSGRIAQLTLRDAQGKAKVLSQFLRATEQSSGGLFGSIKGLLGAGAWKRDVAAVHTRQLGPRGQMQVLSLTEHAEFQTWDLNWSGHYTFKGTLDFRELVKEELKKLESPELQGKYETIKALDFVIVERIPSQSNDIATIGTGLALDIMILLQVGSLDNCEHVIAGVIIQGQDVAVPQLLQMTTSQRPLLSENSTSRPRLLLPKPAHTAVVVFQDGIIVKELDDSEANSPEAQLHASYLQPTIFEDSVYVRRDKAITIVDACEEGERAGNESVVAFINGAGLARLTVVDPNTVEREAVIPIKTKIEQAIFHGALQDGNILDFSRAGDGIYPPEDIETAAVTISDEILRSSSTYVSTSPTSMETHLAYKAQALRALASHVRQNYPTVSNSVMWQLLSDAERVAAAQQLWKMFEDQVSASDPRKRIAMVLNDMCTMAIEELGGVPIQSASDDAVRMFLIYKLHRLDKLLTLGGILLKELEKDTERTPQTKLRLVDEVDDVWNRTLETVFNFRTENAAAYGILPQLLEDGILVEAAECTGLPEFWTSTAPMLKAVVRTAELSRTMADEEFEEVKSDAQSTLDALIQNIGAHNPRLIVSMCRMYQERITWLASRPSEKERDLAEHLRTSFAEIRHVNIRQQADIAQAEAGMRLAEKYGDMHTLTEMVIAEMQFSVDQLHATPERDQARIMEYIGTVTARVRTYFDRYGDAWANAYFDQGFAGSQAGVMLRDAQDNWQKSLTRYLRAEPSRAKMCWINDIIADNDFGRASERLIIVARDQESKLWEKKVELSMSKLALLATQEDLQANGAPMTDAELKHAIPDGDLEVVSTQEQLYQHMLPDIRHCIDHQAELEVAMQRFATKNQDLHALRQLLESYLDRVLDQVVLSADELIDVLTLIDNVIGDEGDIGNLQGSEFFLALKVLNAIAPRIPQDRFEMLLQLIWKRCYASDNWFEIDSGKQPLDEEAGDMLKDTAAWQTLYYALDEGYFDGPDAHVRLVLPSECLGAGCRPEDLAYRWSSQDLLDPIVMDNKIQDEQLQSCVDDRRLDDWIQTCVGNVKHALRERAEEYAQTLEQQRAMEASIQFVGGTNGSMVNGHATNGIKAEQLEEDGGSELLGMDADGDVQMA